MSLTVNEYIEKTNKTNTEVWVLFDELQMLIDKKEYDKYDTEFRSKFVEVRKKEKEMMALGETREDNKEYVELSKKWLEIITEAKKTVEGLVERERERAEERRHIKRYIKNCS